MYIKITCNYCNKTWEQYVYHTFKGGFKCSKCKESKSFTVQKEARQSIDYYIGSPEFENKTEPLDNEYSLISNPEDIELTSD